MKENLAALLTEQQNPRTARLDRASTEEMLRLINQEDQTVALAVEAAIPQITMALELIVDSMKAGGRLFYTGAGTSGRLGVLDASECPPTFNVSPELVQGFIAGGDRALRYAVEGAEDSPERGASELRAMGFRAGDVLCGIAASGRTPYVKGALLEAREIGGKRIALACTPGALISQYADVAIEVLTGPEVLTGSTRLKAGTATKLVLNMLSTGAMVKLGHTYGNLMVNVQPTNEKLVDRAQRIVAAAAGVRVDEAEILLREAGMLVRTAIVMGRLKIDRAAAEALLAQTGNRVAEALGEVS
ncbi:MAG: N-acetylmuramic acid 6-phosphate etherase [Bryobacter sp.]|nr:N-acetylmuramic acid 6-phosphate etherase [Bryobacter sp.]